MAPSINLSSARLYLFICSVQQQEVRATFRKVVIALVLGTDMKQVGVLLGRDMKRVDGHVSLWRQA